MEAVSVSTIAAPSVTSTLVCTPPTGIFASNTNVCPDASVTTSLALRLNPAASTVT